MAKKKKLLLLPKLPLPKLPLRKLLLRWKLRLLTLLLPLLTLLLPLLTLLLPPLTLLLRLPLPSNPGQLKNRPSGRFFYVWRNRSRRASASASLGRGCV